MSNKQKRAERNEKAERAAQMRRERARQQQRRTRILVTAIVAVVVVILVVAAVAIIPRLGKDGPTPEGVTADNGFRYTAADVPGTGAPTASGTAPAIAPVEVVLYEDFQCPTCKAFESAAGSYLEEQVALGAADVEYRPIAILDRASSTAYSTRSASAAACVYEDAGIDVYVKFHDALYANQPPEGGTGLTADNLAQIAEQSGASDSVASCISRGAYEDWTARATEAASKAGVTGTPTVRVNGKDVTGQGGGAPSMQDLMAAISAARDAVSK